MRRLLAGLVVAGMAAIVWAANQPVITPSRGATPGGSAGQVQYKVSASAFGGIAGSSWDGSTLTLPGISSVTISNAAANTIPHLNASKQLVGTLGDIFWDDVNKRMGLGTSSGLSYDIEIKRNRNGEPVGFYAQNQNSGGDSIIALANDTSSVAIFGTGGTGFPAPYANNAFITSTADVVFLPGSGKNVFTSPAGRGFGVTEGSNAKMGTFALASGVAWVPTTAVTANSRIFLTVQTKSGTSTGVGVTSTTVNAGFNAFGAATDNSTVAYVIFEAY